MSPNSLTRRQTDLQIARARPSERLYWENELQFLEPKNVPIPVAVSAELRAAFRTLRG
jgi:hypothetical protein